MQCKVIAEVTVLGSLLAIFHHLLLQPPQHWCALLIKSVRNRSPFTLRCLCSSHTMAVQHLRLNGRYLHAANWKSKENNCQNKLNKKLLSFSVAHNDYVIPEVWSWPYPTLFRSKHNVFCTRNRCRRRSIWKKKNQPSNLLLVCISYVLTAK